MPSTIYKGDLAEVTLGHETGLVLTRGAWGGLTWNHTTSGDSSIITFRNANPSVVNDSFFTAAVGPVATLAVASGGSNYTTDTGLATTGGSGSGCTVDITASGGAITAATVNAAGTGYKKGETLTVTQSGASGGTLTVTLATTNTCDLKYPAGLLAGSKMRVKGGGAYSSDDHTDTGRLYTIVANSGSTLTVTPALKTTAATDSTSGDELFIDSLGTPTLDVGMAYNSSAASSDETVLTDQFIGLAAEITLPETKVEVLRAHVVGIGRQVVVQEPQHIKNDGGSLSTMMHSARWLYYALGNEAVSAPGSSTAVDDGNNTNAISMGDTYVSFSGTVTGSLPSVGDYVAVEDTTEVLTPYATEPTSRTKWTGTQTLFHSSIRTEVRRVIAKDTTTGFIRLYVDDPFCFDHAAGKVVNSCAYADAASTNSPNFDTTASNYGNISNRQSRALWSMWHQPSFSLETSMRTRDVGSYSGEQSANAPGSANDSKQLTRIYKGCKVRGWELTADADSEVRMKVDFDSLMCYTDTGRLEDSNAGDRYTAHRMFENIANGPKERKVAGIAPNTEKPFFFYNGTIEAFGSNLAQVTNFSLSGENNVSTHLVVRGNPLNESRNTDGKSLEQIPFSGSRNPALSVEGKVEYNLKMTILPTDPLLWHEFRTTRSKGESEPIKLHLKKDGAGGNREEVYLIIDDYIISEAPLQIPEDKGVIKQELTILPRHVKVVAHDALFHC